MRQIFKKILIYIRLTWYSLFYGLENANSILTGQKGDFDDSGVHKVLKRGGAINDMLEQKVTKEVEELRDKHYRILREADKYDTSTIVMSFDADGNPIFKEGRLSKKDKSFFMKHCDVLDEEGFPIRTIQDNKKFEKKSSILNNDESTKDLSIPLGIYDYDTTLTINRDGITPRIFIEKFVTKIVVRNQENQERALVDLYLPTMASQFGKIDAILISNLYTMFETQNFRSDLVDFESIEWYSDKGWNTPDVCLFKYNDIKAKYMSVFDGNFVITFDCNILSDGVYLAEKYKTKELDKKYEENAPKSNAVDLFAANRHCNKKNEENSNIINLETKTFRLNEDSN